MENEYLTHGQFRTVEQLIEIGYCCISLRNGYVSRVDRPDWDKVELEGFGPCPNIDFYRRILSPDTILVSRVDIKKFPCSSLATIGYVEIK